MAPKCRNLLVHFFAEATFKIRNRWRNCQLMVLQKHWKQSLLHDLHNLKVGEFKKKTQIHFTDENFLVYFQQSPVLFFKMKTKSNCEQPCKLFKWGWWSAKFVLKEGLATLCVAENLQLLPAGKDRCSSCVCARPRMDGPNNENADK